ncbi:MAG: galactokinase [Brotaphodocola sp.]
MNIKKLASALTLPSAVTLLEEMYGQGKAKQNAARYMEVGEGFAQTFGDKEFELFSSPGRTEIGGNHTDHNHGKIVAGSVHMDCVAAAAANGTNQVRIVSKTYKQDLVIQLNDLEPKYPYGGTYALLKGILKGMKNRGYRVGGFDMYTTSNVPGGAGVSSSAAFEMLICTVVDYFFNGYNRDLIAYAKSGQYAENVYWKKGSGLLDQLACAAGGIVTIDFANIEAPSLKKVDCNFSDLGVDLVIVNTGGSHADLSEEYSSIPNEMKSVAKFFGKEVLADISEKDVIDRAPEIRKKCGDRSLLRALHFFSENRRVDKEVAALEAKNKEAFLTEVTASGNSSWKWLQNCYVSKTPEHQTITAALALAESYLEHVPGSACRVHGGGFAGVIAAFVPKKETEGFCEFMNRVLGSEAAFVMHIRQQGSIHVEL